LVMALMLMPMTVVITTSSPTTRFLLPPPTTMGVIVVAAAASVRTAARPSDDDEDDYVRQVLEEDQLLYHDGYHHDDIRDGEGGYQMPTGEEERRRLQAEAEKEEEERTARERADRIAAERERQFQAELDRVDDDVRRAALMRQKRTDRRRVEAVLDAAKRGDLYGVLGIRFRWNVRVPALQVNVPLPGRFLGGGLRLRIPGLALATTTERDIRRQFRIRATQVHPDKNRDGRAQEAFIAVEHAASVLSDGPQRASYDEGLRRVRADRNRARTLIVAGAVNAAWRVGLRVVGGTHAVLGPFLTPVLILGFLIL
jgi:DnaJ domain